MLFVKNEKKSSLLNVMFKTNYISQFMFIIYIQKFKTSHFDHKKLK